MSVRNGWLPVGVMVGKRVEVAVGTVPVKVALGVSIGVDVGVLVAVAAGVSELVAWAAIMKGKKLFSS